MQEEFDSSIQSQMGYYSKSFCKQIGCEWIYYIMLKSDGSSDHYKARLKAPENCQEYGSTMKNHFLAVHSQPLLLPCDVLFQMDVKICFLSPYMVILRRKSACVFHKGYLGLHFMMFVDCDDLLMASIKPHWHGLRIFVRCFFNFNLNESMILLYVPWTN